MTNKDKLTKMIRELSDYDVRLLLAFLEKYLSRKAADTSKLN